MACSIYTMNYLKPLGRFAQPGNVPVRTNEKNAMEILGIHSGVVYTFAEAYKPLPGDDEGALNIFHPRPRENATHGMIWDWADLLIYAQSIRHTTWYRGSDFYTAFIRVRQEYKDAYPYHSYGRTSYYRFVPADVIRVQSLTPVDPSQRYELYRTLNDGFVYLEYVFTPPPDAAPTVPAVKPQSPKCSPKKVTKKK